MFENVSNVIGLFEILGMLGILSIQFIGLVWRISKAEQRLYDRISEIEHTTDVEIQKIRSEIIESKLESSNVYLKRDVFISIMSNLDARLIRLEGKLDTVIARKN